MFSPPMVFQHRGDAGFLVTVGHLLCHFQENCDVSSISAWLRAVPVQPSPTRAGEILALLRLNMSSITSVFLQRMVAAPTGVGSQELSAECPVVRSPPATLTSP